MWNFQSRYVPKVSKGDLEEVTALLKVFDVVTFNMDAEFVAQIETSLPIIGPVVISYYVRGDNLKVWRANDKDQEALFSDESESLPPIFTSREELITFVKERIVAAVGIALTVPTNQKGE